MAETSIAPVQWPHESQAGALDAFYGDPRGSGANVNPEWGKANVVNVPCPWRLKGAPAAGIEIHRKCAPTLAAWFSDVWDYYGRDQAKIDAVGLGVTEGSGNFRVNR